MIEEYHGSVHSFSFSGAVFYLVGCDANNEFMSELISSILAISISVLTVQLKADISQEKRYPHDNGCDAETQDCIRRLPPRRNFVLTLIAADVDIKP